MKDAVHHFLSTHSINIRQQSLIVDPAREPSHSELLQLS